MIKADSEVYNEKKLLKKLSQKIFNSHYKDLPTIDVKHCLSQALNELLSANTSNSHISRANCKSPPKKHNPASVLLSRSGRNVICVRNKQLKLNTQTDTSEIEKNLFTVP